MPRPVVLAAWEPREPDEALVVHRTLGRVADIHWLHELTPDLRNELLPRVQVLLVFNWPKDLTPELPRMRALRFIQRFPAGVEGVPFDELRGRRPAVVVASGSGSNAGPVAEHAWALVLACAKRVAFHDRSVRQGRFLQEEVPSLELAGKTLGILGYGAIGRRVARLGRAFNMHVLALRRHAGTRPTPPVIGGLERLARLLRESDVLVVALPLTRETEGLLGAREFAQLKPDAILVNVARGGILDEKAAYEHLAARHNLHWGFDVWWHYTQERQPFKQRFPFDALPNLVMTPHNAAIVPDYRTTMAEFGCRNVARYLRGGPPKNVVDPRDYEGRARPRRGPR